MNGMLSNKLYLHLLHDPALLDPHLFNIFLLLNLIKMQITTLAHKYLRIRFPKPILKPFLTIRVSIVLSWQISETLVIYLSVILFGPVSKQKYFAQSSKSKTNKKKNKFFFYTETVDNVFTKIQTKIGISGEQIGPWDINEFKYCVEILSRKAV